VHWGDLDVQGLEILSSLRAIFPQARSILMDDDTLERLQHLCTAGNAPGPELLPHLTEAERAAYIRCRSENLRLEQERLPSSEVLAALGALPDAFGRGIPGEEATAAAGLLSENRRQKARADEGTLARGAGLPRERGDGTTLPPPVG
jgi:hypothetical protein